MPSLDTHLHASASSCDDPEPGRSRGRGRLGRRRRRRFAEVDESPQVLLSVSLDHRSESEGLRETFAGASPRAVCVHARGGLHMSGSARAPGRQDKLPLARPYSGDSQEVHGRRGLADPTRRFHVKQRLWRRSSHIATVARRYAPSTSNDRVGRGTLPYARRTASLGRRSFSCGSTGRGHLSCRCLIRSSGFPADSSPTEDWPAPRRPPVVSRETSRVWKSRASGSKLAHRLPVDE